MLEAAGLECERGGRVLFRGLSLSLKEGKLLRIAGANGRGKTSLLRILCGLLAPSAGEVRWQGSPIQALREDYTRQLVYIGHAPAVKDELSAAENLSIACRLSGNRRTEREVREALEQLGVPPAPFVRRLSQGQRRRAALARLVVSRDLPLWLLDEPFAALDAAAVELLQQMVSAHASRGGTVVLTTHQEVRLVLSAVLDLDGGLA